MQTQWYAKLIWRKMKNNIILILCSHWTVCWCFIIFYFIVVWNTKKQSRSCSCLQSSAYWMHPSLARVTWSRWGEGEVRDAEGRDQCSAVFGTENTTPCGFIFSAKQNSLRSRYFCSFSGSVTHPGPTEIF